MQLKTKSTTYTEPNHRPHPENLNAGPRDTDEKNGKEDGKENNDAESPIHPKDFDLPVEEGEENVDDEIDAEEEANRPG